jgi:hypothetical protein
MSCDWTGQMVMRKSEDAQRRLLLLGEKAGLRANVKTQMSREGREAGEGFLPTDETRMKYRLGK